MTPDKIQNFLCSMFLISRPVNEITKLCDEFIAEYTQWYDSLKKVEDQRIEIKDPAL